MGLGVQSVLWSDPEVFARFSELEGNRAMYTITQTAATALVGRSYSEPGAWLEDILPTALETGRQATQRPTLRTTFALNALVPVDLAAWMLWARASGASPMFESLIPAACRPAMHFHAEQISCVPAVGYGLALSEIVKAVSEGHSLLKIKIGSDPDQDGSPEKMLAWDIARLTSIDSALRSVACPTSPDQRCRYYLDANGRYDSRQRVLDLLDACEANGFLERVVLLEEPFAESMDIEVHDMPVRVAADERAHTDADVRRCAALGYGAVALKPIAKTLSMSFRMVQAAHEEGLPCFCADLTVNPILVDWNKLFQAHLPPLPGMLCGFMESNGHQNYRNWDAMQTYHPAAGADWTRVSGGSWHLSSTFYEQSAGIERDSPHYAALFNG